MPQRMAGYELCGTVPKRTTTAGELTAASTLPLLSPVTRNTGGSTGEVMMKKMTKNMEKAMR